MSTEGFCEGESTDGSPGSTLNKSSLKSSKSFGNSVGRRISEQPDGEVDRSSRIILADRRNGIVRAEPLEIYGSEGDDTKATIARSESKDDGMDCNFASDDEDEEIGHEPIYVNSCNENNARNLRDDRKKTDDDDGDHVKEAKDSRFDNNNE